ncbi:cytochrome P450 [Sistotremastrum niveocremeum HHB9708]|uniref:Cytochrome P450 n=1 Tax=Sistotremastrum niveocremeum HHB9708 TaxID=1314777 RepID=A0A164PGX1_9AGAM|nr:cytochrome P450 [Sistotremastrum niveocremeum HHB9708]
MDSYLVYYELLFVTVFISFILYLRKRPTCLPPPGPRGSFFSGTRSIIVTRKDVWRQYAEWSKIYGPVISFKSHKVNIVVLNSAKSIHNLLDSRSKLYSDRPSSAMNQLVGQDSLQTRISSRNPHFPLYRKMAHEELAWKGMSRHVPVLESQVKSLLKNLMSDPKNFSEHLRSYQGGSVMKAIYGYTAESSDDFFIKFIQQWWQVNNATMRTGSWLVDSYPILKYLPSWMPGAGFKEFAAQRKASIDDVMSLPFAWAKSDISTGRAYASFVASQLNRQEGLTSEDEEIIKLVSGSMYVTGTDSVLSTMLTFFLTMTLNPAAQKIAQEEISRVIGSDRLPLLTDRDRLPYVDALIKEVYRFHTPAPLALPHAVTQDDMYEGMFIQKGSIVVPNVWAVTHDESVYPDPDTFDPTRYLKSEDEKGHVQPDPRNFVFGFGRRVCPGKQFGESAVFLQIASILATFNISKALDAHGTEITPEIDYKGGIVTQPEEFVCKIVPRSDAAIDLIMWSH